MKHLLILAIILAWLFLLATSRYPDPKLACGEPALPCDEQTLGFK